MELTQEQLDWINREIAKETILAEMIQKESLINEVRSAVGKKYEKKLKKLADEGKIEERKALIEQMSKEADEAEKRELNKL